MHLRNTILLTATIAALSGCASDSTQEQFFSQRIQPSAFVNKQTDLGAAKDATLHASHFSAGKLNGLGTAKLDSIVRGTPDSTPVIIYLQMKEDAQTRDEVLAYLSGGRDATVRFGANPANLRPGYEGLRELDNQSEFTPGGAGGGTPDGTPAAQGPLFGS